MPFLKKEKENDDFLRNEGQQKTLLGGKLAFVKKIQILYLYFNIA